MGAIGHVIPGAQVSGLFTSRSESELTLGSTQARLVDLESGKDVAQGERGELWVRGLNVMKAYHRNPEATKDTFSPASSQTPCISRLQS